MDKAPLPETEPPNLRFLRLLVTILTGTMIVGLLTIIGLFVMRFSQPISAPLPDEVTLPGDARAQAFTQSASWYAVVTDQNEILIFDRSSGALRQTVKIAEPGEN